MIAEGVIALIWATAGLSFYENPKALHDVIAAGSPALVVDQVCKSLLGPVGGVLAILAVIILPITSGDTAFRSTRLILAETFKVRQGRAVKRLILAVPLFAVAYGISFFDFQIIWRYFGWSNQTLAMLVLWTAGIYPALQGKFHWIASVPASFMTAVSLSFILQAPIGFHLPARVSNIAAILAATIALVALTLWAKRKKPHNK